MKRKRYFGLDIVRILALCLLLWLHFFLRNGFYSQKVNHLPMTFAVAGRIIFMCCIPLFLMLTGYLKCGKEWKKGYYRSLLPILISWVVISGICLWYKLVIAKDEMTVYEWIVEFFNFGIANYSWYIEMYIGLLLFSPVLNMAWEGAKTKEKRITLLGVMVFMTFLPKTVNVLKFDGENTLNLLPNYWTSLYFFTYYFIGCYIKTYQPKLPKRFAIPMLLMIALIFALINRLTAGENGKFNSGFTISYNHVATAAIAVLLFLSVYQLDCKNKYVQKIAAFISGVTLEMYLISCVFDQQIYVWGKGTYGPKDYWWRGMLACGLVFILSLVSGWAVHSISTYLSRLCWQLIDRKKQGNSEVVMKKVG